MRFAGIAAVSDPAGPAASSVSGAGRAWSHTPAPSWLLVVAEWDDVPFRFLDAGIKFQVSVSHNLRSPHAHAHVQFLAGRLAWAANALARAINLKGLEPCIKRVNE